MKKLVVFVLVLAIYGVSVFGGFVQDDTKVIEGDSQMGRVSALGMVWTRPYYYMQEGNAGAYRPLTSFSFYLNALVTGKDAWGFHLVNVLLYAGVCVLVYQLIIRFEKMWARRAQTSLHCPPSTEGHLPRGVRITAVPFLFSVLFTVLPVHTEAVNNIVGRAEILSLGFVLFAVLFQMKKRWELSALVFLLALLSKETAMVGLPILIYLMVVGKEERETKSGAVSIYVLSVVFYLVLRVMVLGNGGMENGATMVENPLKFVSTEQRVMNAFALIPFGVGKIVFPIYLSYDYSFNQIKLATSWFDWRVVLGMGMMAFSIGSLLTPLRKNRLWILGQAFFWGPLFITGNFLFPVGTIFGERLWFWGSLGMVLMFLSWFEVSQKPCSRVPVSRKARMDMTARGFCQTSAQIIISAVLCIFIGRTVVRNVDWLSQDRLFRHDAVYAKDSVMAQSNAAAMYLLKKDFVRGKEYLEKAEMIYPKYPELMNNWGMYYLWTGDTKTARERFEKCLAEKPGFYLCEGNLEMLK